MKNLENYGVLELNTEEVRNTLGGGPIADLVHWLIHDADWTKYPSGYVQGQHLI